MQCAAGLGHEIHRLLRFPRKVAWVRVECCVCHVVSLATLRRLFPAVMTNIRSGDQTRVMGALIALRVLAKRFE